MKAASAALASELAGVGVDGGQAFRDIAAVVTENLIPGLDTVKSRLGGIIDEARRLKEEFETNNPLPFLPGTYSGGGKFTDADGNAVGVPTFDETSFQQAGTSAAATFLKQFEGFMSKAKWDVNHFRVGFGSDTATRADGSVETVTASTMVSLADANRDLGRRIVEFQNTIKGQIGADTFASLSENQQGALTSIAYNYGQLPDRIVQAILGGGGQGAVAGAIAGLSGDNGGINKKRRLQEAELYGGGQFSAREAGYGATTAKKTPDQIYDLDIQKAQDQIKVLQAVVAAQGGAKAAIDQTAVAVEAARIKQQLLNEAQRAGLAITPELTARAGDLANQLATLKAQQDANTTSQKTLNQASQEFASFGKDILGGFINDLRQGKSASEALANALNKVADKLLDMALNSIFGGEKGGGGFLSFLFPGVGKKDGGPIHLANGGRVRGRGSSRSDSIPAMLSNGEYVVNAASAGRHRGLLDQINGGGLLRSPPPAPVTARPPVVQPKINVHNYGADVTTKSKRGSNGDMELDMFVRNRVRDENMPGGTTNRMLRQGYDGLQPKLIER